MVFIPDSLMELEAGQLFRDIAVAISVSVMLSLVVAMTVIPALSQSPARPGKPRLDVMPLPVVDHFGRAFCVDRSRYARLTVGSRMARYHGRDIITGGAIWAAATFLPKLEYLPDGNRNLVFGIILPPPGYNLPTTTKIARAHRSRRASALGKRGDRATDRKPPAMKHFFFVAVRGTTFLGGSAKDPTRVRELIPVLSSPIFSEPGTFGFIKQRSLFGRGIGGGRTIELNISGAELMIS